ncbi:PREDICTED: insulin-like peptide INSL6 [Elephantulus edwardii]|uniref:insulin-like peptide INSL6 n=1 Tax=Elephantulus edwardii TaxID=28737 RepID=UPI0003F06818|nr:PREDICTED: insulin-like peptide INSL6 [Elephantulus edwardii]
MRTQAPPSGAHGGSSRRRALWGPLVPRTCWELLSSCTFHLCSRETQAPSGALDGNAVSGASRAAHVRGGASCPLCVLARPTRSEAWQLGLLLILFNLELGSPIQSKKLCGRHLLKEIVKLCGLEDWSLFEGPPLHWQLVPRAVEAAGVLFPTGIPRSPLLPPGKMKIFFSPCLSTASPVSVEEATHGLKMQSLPQHQHQKVNSLREEMRKFYPSHTHPYIRETAKFKKENANRIKALSSSFWGSHPQRKRRGYSEKCCLKGCTREELSIACAPYIAYRKIKPEQQL